MIVSHPLTLSGRDTIQTAIVAAFTVFSAVAAFAPNKAPADGQVQLRLRRAPQEVLAVAGAEGMRFLRCLQAGCTTQPKRNCWPASRCSASRNPPWTPAGYCEKAKHYDYTWFEMQHSTLEFKDIEAMIAACPHAAAIPMIRLPDAQEIAYSAHYGYWMPGRDRADSGRCGSGSGSG